jgi:hypothetical protein
MMARIKDDLWTISRDARARGRMATLAVTVGDID